MLCRFYDLRSGKLLGYMRAKPRCGEDFCDACGDCLACYGGDECARGQTHVWVKEVESEEEARGIAEEYKAVFVAGKEERAHGQE